MKNIIEQLNWTIVHGSQEQAIDAMTNAIATIERLQADKAKLIDLLAEARGPQGEAHGRVAEWLQGHGYIITKEVK